MRRWVRVLLLVSGIVLVTVGVCVLFLWSYCMLPIRKFTLGNHYIESYDAIQWELIQEDIRRTGGFHDTWLEVGWFGGKRWAERVIEMLRNGAPLDYCGDWGPCHLHSVLKEITNQNAGDSTEDWLRWWDINKEKTQAQWWLDGFQSYGLHLQIPPSQNDIVTFLRILGTEDPKARHPRLRHLTCFKWLRDNDFNENIFSVSDLPTDDPQTVLRGLLKYTLLKANIPKCKGTGILDMGVPDEPEHGGFVGLPVYDLPIFIWGTRCVIFLLLAGGSTCLWFYWKKRKISIDPQKDE